MDKRKLEELIDLVEERDIQEISVSGPFTSVRIVRSPARAHAQPSISTQPPAEAAGPPPAAAPENAAEPSEPPGEADRDSGLVPVTSPMVGTFYSGPSPESEPYVRQGQHISKGQVVCIIEAMKLFNEIESEVSGTVVRVLLEGGEPVEYGQKLFLVQPD